MGGGLWTSGREKKQTMHSLRAVCLVGLLILPPALAAGGTSWEPLRAAGSVQGSSCPAPYHIPAGSRPQPLSTWAGRSKLPAGSWKSASVTAGVHRRLLGGEDLGGQPALQDVRGQHPDGV